ncbi:MAG: DinB family protein [Dehalococcoidia bacterium]|nr:DinB family protein [Dehalococcoidia bacterium]
MDATTVLKSQLKEAHDWLDATIQGVGPQQLHWNPAGKANNIAACCAHVVTSEDFVVNGMLKGAPPPCSHDLGGQDWPE